MSSGMQVAEIPLGTGALAARGTVVTSHDRCFLRRGDLFRSADGAAPRGQYPTLLV